MTNNEIIEIIVEMRAHNSENFIRLFEGFERLIMRYEHYLGYDDAKQDMVLFFTELLYKLDIDRFKKDASDTLQRYIAVALRNNYISLSKGWHKYSLSSNEFFDSYSATVCDIEGYMDLKAALSLLSERQRQIILERYISGYSDAEIAKKHGITRQAVNRLQTRGFKAIRDFYKQNT